MRDECECALGGGMMGWDGIEGRELAASFTNAVETRR